MNNSTRGPWTCPHCGRQNDPQNSVCVCRWQPTAPPVTYQGQPSIPLSQTTYQEQRSIPTHKTTYNQVNVSIQNPPIHPSPAKKSLANQIFNHNGWVYGSAFVAILFIGSVVGAWVISTHQPPPPPPIPTPTPTPTPIPLVQVSIQLTSVYCEHTKNLFGPDEFVIQYSFTAPAVDSSGVSNGQTDPLEMHNGDNKGFPTSEQTVFDANLSPDGAVTGTLKAYRVTDSGAIEPLGSKDVKFNAVGDLVQNLTWPIHGQDPTSVIPNVWDYTVQYLVTRENITGSAPFPGDVMYHSISGALMGAFRERATSL